MDDYMLLDKDQLTEVAKAMLRARDFCANEYQYAIDALAEVTGLQHSENELIFDRWIFDALMIANEMWDEGE